MLLFIVLSLEKQRKRGETNGEREGRGKERGDGGRGKEGGERLIDSIYWLTPPNAFSIKAWVELNPGPKYLSRTIVFQVMR